MSEADVSAALRQVSEVAERYGVTDYDVERWRDPIADRPPWAQRAYISATIAQGLVGLAVVHEVECDRPACHTCDKLRLLLTMALAGVRTVVDDELHEVYRRPASGGSGRPIKD
ncbi:hypothetical protein [Actinoplanes sp. NPDC051851]|uniref:hypothetical protein n=1 Tax=Actinoplanes sp. NPDC051851 TaxID=3154753 RepID=UPI00341DD420